LTKSDHSAKITTATTCTALNKDHLCGPVPERLANSRVLMAPALLQELSHCNHC